MTTRPTGRPERPTLYLTNAASRSHHGPGRLFTAMAAPPHWLAKAASGNVAPLAPLARLLRLVRDGKVPVSAYGAAYTAHVLRMVTHGFLLPPNRGKHLRARSAIGSTPVEGGDTLVCTCPRPDSPKRVHPCHIELAAVPLLMSGWNVVLHGRRWSMRTDVQTGIPFMDPPDDAYDPDARVSPNDTPLTLGRHLLDLGWDVHATLPFTGAPMWRPIRFAGADHVEYRRDLTMEIGDVL